MNFEMEAFMVSVQETIRIEGVISDTTIQAYAKNFTGARYFFMAYSYEACYKKLRQSADIEMQTFAGLVKVTKEVIEEELKAKTKELAAASDARSNELSNLLPMGRA